MLKKLLSVLLAVVLAVGAFSVATFAQSSERQLANVEVIKAPLKSRIVFDNEISLEGFVLKITHPDGREETVTVEQADDGSFVAGNYEVMFKWTDDFAMPILRGYGKVSVPIYIVIREANVGHSIGSVAYDYINLPSLKSVFALIELMLHVGILYW